jgi:hypothetical protein
MIDGNLFFDPFPGTDITSTGYSANKIDFSVARDVGAGIKGPLEIHVQVRVSFTAVGAATLQIELRGSPDNTTYSEFLLSPVYAKTDLTALKGVFRYRWPIVQLNETTPGEYYRLRYVVSAGPFTAGRIAAWITAGGDRDQVTQYPNNYTA